MGEPRKVWVHWFQTCDDGGILGVYSTEDAATASAGESDWVEPVYLDHTPDPRGGDSHSGPCPECGKGLDGTHFGCLDFS